MRNARSARPLHALSCTLAITLAIPSAAAAQTRDEERARAERDGYFRDQRVLMYTLAGWAATSIATGTVMWAGADGHEATRWAGIQNVAWGAVDGALAALALYNLSKDAGEEKTEMGWRADRARTQRVFTWNAGLDLLYVAVGGALAAFGKDDGLRGAGAAILVQGGFLLAFDTTAALVIRPSWGASGSQR